MGKTVEAVKLMLRAMYLVALFSPCLIMGAFVEEKSHFRTLWMHMLLRTLELAGKNYLQWRPV
jgi:aarF domain-containing kinase